MKILNKIITVLIITFILSCNTQHRNSKLSSQDSLKIGLIDSLEKLKPDSIANSNREETANLNIPRPKSNPEETANPGRPWHIGTFVDTSGDPTNERFVQTTVDGTFSNSATTNSYLFVEVFFKKNAAGIYLRENNKTQPPKKFVRSVQIQMKNSANKEITIRTARAWNQSGGILIENHLGRDVKQIDFSNFRDFIKASNGEIKVVIHDDNASVYNFTIDTSGFEEEFTKI